MITSLKIDFHSKLEDVKRVPPPISAYTAGAKRKTTVSAVLHSSICQKSLREDLSKRRSKKKKKQ